MEVVVTIAVIVVLCIILGVSTSIMITAAFALAGLVILAMTLLFIYFFIHLAVSKKTNASFTRIDQGKNWKFRTAYYKVDGKEYPCVFPSEPKFVYKEGKEYKVRFNKRLGGVFDKWAVTTCILGMVFSILASAGAVYLALNFIFI